MAVISMFCGQAHGELIATGEVVGEPASVVKRAVGKRHVECRGKPDRPA